MAKKTLIELAENAQILADDMADIAGAVAPDPVRDIFKPRDVVTAVQLKQMAYKLRVQSATLSKHAEFIEKNAKKVEEYRPAYWRMYTGLYADAVEDQMDKVLYCLKRMEEDTAKLAAEPGGAFGYDQSRSMITELTEIGEVVDANYKKEVEEMLD